MKILILTNHLAVFGGSEIVALEVADVFSQIGCDVNIYTAYIDGVIQSYMDKLAIQYDLIENCPNPENFDIIWSQHQLLTYILAKYGTRSVKDVFLVNTSLSPYEPLEIPGAITEIADMIVANSPETAERLAELGVNTDKVSVFYNAAPDAFNLSRTATPCLKRVLIISNHMPEEITCAAVILRKHGIIVDHIGLPSQQKRITPEIISSFDAVISIGKSVQYSILCETPVYVYDRFGGPGWLNESNVVEAEKFNFSGRCCRRQLSSETIVHELLHGYSDASSAIRALKQTYAEKYTLRNYLTQIIEHAANRMYKDDEHQIDPIISNIIHREGLLSGQLVAFYKVTQNQSAEITDMHSNLKNLSIEIANLTNHISEMDVERQKILRTHDELYSSLNRVISEKSAVIDQLERKLSEIMDSTFWRITKPLRTIKERFLR